MKITNVYRPLWKLGVAIMSIAIYILFLGFSIGEIINLSTHIGNLTKKIEFIRSRSVGIAPIEHEYKVELARARETGLIIGENFDAAASQAREEIEKTFRENGIIAKSTIAKSHDENPAVPNIKITAEATASGEAITKTILKLEATNYAAIERIEMRRIDGVNAANAVDSNVMAKVEIEVRFLLLVEASRPR